MRSRGAASELVRRETASIAAIRDSQRRAITWLWRSDEATIARHRCWRPLPRIATTITLTRVDTHMQFDHAGIATDDAAELAGLFADLFDAQIEHEETFDGMAVVFLSVGDGYFELLEPLDDEGPIANYLDRQGPGIHHLAVETDDATAALDRARELGIEPIDQEPREGAWGHDVAFLHPRDTGGVLIEFVEH